MAAYKNLEAWKHSMQLVKEIYILTKTFPREEIYALSSQLKRAAVSVPSNIAEGCGRNYKKDAPVQNFLSQTMHNGMLLQLA